MKRILGFIFLLFAITSFAQQPIDVQHYKFEIEIGDQSDVINGKAIITTKFLEASSQVIFNLATVEEDKGMQTFAVLENGRPLQFIHRNNELRIITNANKGDVKSFEIQYMGNPKDGLIISKNKYGERTFFADNWPNRAQNWIPCHDTPSDKASVEFIVFSPTHYKIISNGALVQEKVTGSKKMTHWKEDVAIPTKVMVIGAANFAVARVDSSFRLPVTSWTYKQDSAKGVFDYALADDIIKFFEGYVGPYPYKKLANVQSKTIFGGMENANAIFYAENTVTGDRKSEALIAHEIAHQWFGNSATEKSFSHLWLSEGFATYMTHLWIEQKYGVDSFQKRMEQDRKGIIAFAKQSNLPVVDSVTEYMELLNANSYQKGGWVLHMLRQEVGDKTFKEIIKAYYNQYKFSNADTRDFQAVAEKVSGKDLKWFFDQWLYQPGVPNLKIESKRLGDTTIQINVFQDEQNIFKFPLIIGAIVDGKRMVKVLNIAKKHETFVWALHNKASNLILDPYVTLLFQATLSEKK